ncbi:flavin reductase family protein [Mycolicibacterium smegmatis]|jgi:flavin reductase (DIM6/NTAB) family NADH-FMN oxidoreductase RutF|nr:flavin reductase family protein [Mycolicibacterium smegmatis]MCC3335244.1 flavin reductase family protein [Mycolicibacterium smegmatis]MCO4194864.1 flavin reductase family protein [Mycolicibacterium smegmatis]UGU29752.1 flavin reductase family protein [Mycolicibacterium smegmatis]UUR96736.1 flavin reductase family protein [Mycolicibacterium smegmatis]UUS03293.1 flavin reductase family protein [Mycolicibacterium smegmatis]
MVTAEQYRAALRRHPAGVAIVTMMSTGGPVGFTATSFASLSLSPPLISFNITETSSSIEAMRAAESVVVHLPGADQLPLAQRFSRSAEHRFADPCAWSLLPTGEPVLHGVPTWLRAGVERLIEAGDSTLVIGEVAQIHCEDGAECPEPLLYHNGAYLGTRPLT